MGIFNWPLTIDDWLAGAAPAITQSFTAFVGSNGYTLTDLRANLDRFVGILGGATTADRYLDNEPY
ncbi:hypothetical protein [Nocardia araoensis]|uniref:hypothetical protein n=1 Tax=Nocardia araoensis TaxID=228600 RepID=UPI0002DA8C08|nr:hypothetical protein [Nocardia araoensis]